MIDDTKAEEMVAALFRAAAERDVAAADVTAIMDAPKEGSATERLHRFISARLTLIDARLRLLELAASQMSDVMHELHAAVEKMSL